MLKQTNCVHSVAWGDVHKATKKALQAKGSWTRQFQTPSQDWLCHRLSSSRKKPTLMSMPKLSRVRHLPAYAFFPLPIQCPYGAHTVPIQCPLKKHAVPIHFTLRNEGGLGEAFFIRECMGTACFFNGHCMGTVWALYGHCMGTYKKPHEADVSQSVVNKFPDGRVDVAVLA